MQTSWHPKEKSSKVCIKAKSPVALLAFIGQVTKHITVKIAYYISVRFRAMFALLLKSLPCVGFLIIPTVAVSLTRTNFNKGS